MLMHWWRWWLSSSLTVCYKLVCCRNTVDRNARKSGSKNFSQGHSTLNFWRQVPESKYLEFKTPVYNSFLCIAQHFAVIFFSVMKFVKSNHLATLKNEHLGELIGTALTTYCPEFRGQKIKQKLNTDNYCTSINVKLAFFIIFVLTLQNGFVARWCIRPFVLHREQPEKDKQNIDFAPTWKNFCGRPCSQAISWFWYQIYTYLDFSQTVDIAKF